MTATQEFLAAHADQRPKARINGNNQYIFPDPDTGKDKAWTRVTTLAKTIEDNFGLMRWEKRVVLQGAAMKPDLCVAALAAEDNDDLDRLAETAKEHAGGNAGSRMGTAMHALCDRVDRGEKLTVPASVRRDLDAYRKAIAPFDIEAIERHVCLPTIGVAGAVDRYVRQRASGGPLVVWDLKTGRADSHKWVPWLIQVTLYVRAKLWIDLATETWQPLEDVEQDYAYICHLPQGEGTATLYRLDLALGDELIEQCLEVRRVRRYKDFVSEVDLASLVAPTTPQPPVGAGQAAGGREPASVPDASPAASEGRGGLTLAADNTRPHPLSVDDDGVTADAATVRRLRSLVAELDPLIRARLAVWEKDAVRFGRAMFGNDPNVTRRMLSCSRAAIACAQHLQDFQVYLGLAQVLDLGQPREERGGAIPPHWMIGPTIGSLSTYQADALTKLALTARDTGALDPF